MEKLGKDFGEKMDMWGKSMDQDSTATGQTSSQKTENTDNTFGKNQEGKFKMPDKLRERLAKRDAKRAQKEAYRALKGEEKLKRA